MKSSFFFQSSLSLSSFHFVKTEVGCEEKSKGTRLALEGLIFSEVYFHLRIQSEILAKNNIIGKFYIIQYLPSTTATNERSR